MESKRIFTFSHLIIWLAAALVGWLVVLAEQSPSGLGLLSIVVLILLTAAVHCLLRGVRYSWAWSALMASVVAFGALAGAYFMAQMD